MKERSMRLRMHYLYFWVRMYIKHYQKYTSVCISLFWIIGDAGIFIWHHWYRCETFWGVFISMCACIENAYLWRWCCIFYSCIKGSVIFFKHNRYVFLSNFCIIHSVMVWRHYCWIWMARCIVEIEWWMVERNWWTIYISTSCLICFLLIIRSGQENRIWTIC